MKIKKNVKRLSREKLEKLVTKKVKKHLEAESELVKLQKTCQELKEEVQQYKERTEKLAKGYAYLAKLVNNPGDKKGSATSESPKIPKGTIEVDIPSFPPRVTSNDSLPTPSLKLTQTKAGLEVF